MFELEKLRLTEIALNEALENKRLLNEIELLKREKIQLECQIKNLSKDELTGLYNRTVACEAYLKTDSVIMCDIDDFKKLNDNYGHNFGDIILKQVSQILISNTRNTDYPIRWGGEEFVILIDNENIEFTYSIAEKIRDKIELLEGEILEDGRNCPRITMSFGVAILHRKSSLTEDLEEADRALYESKKKGKNKVTISKCREKSLARVKRLR